MRAENNTERWTSHRKGKKCRLAKRANETFITGFFTGRSSSGSTPHQPPPPKHTVACPGLGHAQNERIPKYLARTVVASGGARRREVIRDELLSQHAKSRRKGKLTKQQIRDRVLAAERAEAKWINHHHTGTVSSPKCNKRAQISASGEVLPCTACRKLKGLKLFQNAIRKRAPRKGRGKYVPEAFRNPVAGEAYLRHVDVQELMEMVSTNTYEYSYILTAFSSLPVGFHGFNWLNGAYRDATTTGQCS